MIKRQWRLLRIAAVAEEYHAALTAATLLGDKLTADPAYGRIRGWRPRAGRDFADNLEGNLSRSHVCRVRSWLARLLEDLPGPGHAPNNGAACARGDSQSAFSEGLHRRCGRCPRVPEFLGARYRGGAACQHADFHGTGGQESFVCVLCLSGS